MGADGNPGGKQGGDVIYAENLAFDGVASAVVNGNDEQVQYTTIGADGVSEA